MSLEEDQDLGGDVGLSDDTDSGDTSVDMEDEEGFLLPPLPPPCIDCCIKQWILNQFDLRPYREPDFDMPTMRHFLKRHALQAVRFFLSTTHR